MNRQRLKKILLACGLLAILFYSYYEFRGFLSGPELIIETPKDGAVVDTEVIDISGSTQRISKITLNGRRIFVDEHGDFSLRLPLLVGVNYVTMSVEDRFGNTKTQSLEVIYKGSPTPPRPEPTLPEESAVDEIATSSDSDVF